MSRDTEDKKKALNRWLIDEFVLIHVSTGATDVVIPEHLKSAPTVILKLSRAFPGKLLIEDTHVEAELRFRGVYFTCKIPFSAIWGIESMKGERKMWMASTPPELIATLLAQQVDPQKTGPLGKTLGDEPALKIVSPGASSSENPSGVKAVPALSIAKSKSPEPEKKPSLRIEKAEELSADTLAAEAAAEPPPPETPGKKPRSGRPNLKLVK